MSSETYNIMPFVLLCMFSRLNLLLSFAFAALSKNQASVTKGLKLKTTSSGIQSLV